MGQRRRDSVRRVRRPTRLQPVRAVRPRLSDRGARQRRRDLLAEGAAPRRRAAHRVSRARDHGRTGTDGRVAPCTTTATARCTSRRASLVVLAANGIGTPRLLLNSRSPRFPERTGEPQRPGRQEPDVPPLRRRSAASSPNPSTARLVPIGSIIFSHEFYETDPQRDFVRGFRLQIVRQSGPLHTALGGFTLKRVPWGAQHHARLRRALRPPDQHRRDGRGPARDDQRSRRSTPTCPTPTASRRRWSATG